MLSGESIYDQDYAAYVFAIANRDHRTAARLAQSVLRA
jgi:hypothetical protein